MLLPWYVTGRLDQADVTRVEAYLARHPEMRMQFELIREEQSGATAVNEAIVPSRSMTIERLMQQATASSGGGAAGWLGRLRGLLAMPTAGPLRWAAAAAVVVMLAQGVVIGTLVGQRTGAQYTTASGGGSTADGTFAIVRFADGASAKAITETLVDLGMMITEGPKPGGLYTVRIGPKTLKPDEVAQKIAEIGRRSGVVSLVMPTR